MARSIVAGDLIRWNHFGSIAYGIVIRRANELGFWIWRADINIVEFCPTEWIMRNRVNEGSESLFV